MSPSSVDGVIPSPQWFELYQHAVVEIDDGKLQQRIGEARHAIYDRVDGIVSDPIDELSVLGDALHVLKVLEEISAKRKPAA